MSSPQRVPIICSVDWRGRPFFSTQLHHMIGNDLYNDDWQTIIDRSITDPDEVGRQGAFYGQTALHLACYKYPPLRAVKALIDACPNIAIIQNVDGETPLHIGIEGTDEDVLKFIIESDERCVSILDKNGDSPLHLACRSDMSLDFIRIIANVNPKLVNQPNRMGLTPLHLLPQYYIRARCVEDVTGDGEFAKIWEKIKFLVQVCSSGSVEICNSTSFRYLHAAIKSKCPRPFIFTAARFFPKYLKERDENGDSPLSIAAAIDVFDDPEDREIECENMEFDIFYGGDEQAGIVTSLQEAIFSKQSIIDFLAQENPTTASMINKKGRIPLSIAVESGKGWEEGLRSLLYAYPSALYTRDTATHLVPFMIAAVDDNSSHTTVYELLRALPALISFGIVRDDRINNTGDTKIISKPANGEKKREFAFISVSESHKKGIVEPNSNSSKKICNTQVVQSGILN